MAKIKEVTLSKAMDDALLEWLNLRQQKASLDAKEFELRQRIVREAGFDVKKLEGSESVEIGKGYKLKVVKVQNYTLTNEHGETSALLDAIGIDMERADLAVGLVKWKPDMSTKTYKELLDAIKDSEAKGVEKTRSALAKALTVKPGAPQLELVAPEVKDEIKIESAVPIPPQ